MALQALALIPRPSGSKAGGLIWLWGSRTRPRVLSWASMRFAGIR